jgi:hypothetical protein
MGRLGSAVVSGQYLQCVSGQDLRESGGCGMCGGYVGVLWGCGGYVGGVCGVDYGVLSRMEGGSGLCV